MSHRGNFIIVEANEHRVKGQRDALVLPMLMFWGYDFISDYPESDYWYDIVWDEGSALIDPQNRVVIFHSGEYLSVEIPRRRLFLEFMQNVWNDWDVRWAYNGILEIGDYVDYDRSLLDDSEFKDHNSSKEQYTVAYSFFVEYSDKEDWHDAIVSVRLPGSSIRLRYASELYELLEYGEKLVETIIESAKYSTIEWEVEERGFPLEGIHVDIPEQSVYFWSCQTIPNPEEHKSVWEGWNLIWLKDDFEKHVELTRGQLNIPVPSNDQLLNEIKAYLLFDHPKINRLEHGPIMSHGMEITSYVTYYVERLPPIEERTKIFNNAVEAWRASHS